MKEAKKQKNINYQLGYSNFTFELWIILHKRDCFGRFNDRHQYLVHLQRCFDEKFEKMENYKSEATFKRCLDKLTLEDVKQAIKRADEIEQRNIRNKKPIINNSGFKYYRENPALSIHRVVKKIISECGIL